MRLLSSGNAPIYALAICGFAAIWGWYFLIYGLQGISKEERIMNPKGVVSRTLRLLSTAILAHIPLALCISLFITTGYWTP
tara:strand:- start:668 stop:910 length:243 start_codon:yes stop_codon:yes gene_type:complete